MEHKQALYRAAVAFELIGIRKSKGYELIKAGRLRTVELDGLTMVPAEAIDEFVANLVAAA